MDKNDRNAVGIINLIFSGVLLYFSLGWGWAPFLNFPLYLFLGVGVLKNYRRLIEVLLVIIFLMFFVDIYMNWIWANTPKPAYLGGGQADLPLEVYRFFAFYFVPWALNAWFYFYSKKQAKSKQ